MKVIVSTKEISGKERTVLSFRPETELEEKAMRSIAVVRTTKYELLTSDVVLELPVAKTQRVRRLVPSDFSKHENIEINKLPELETCQETEEAGRALRTIGLAKAIGIKLPKGTKLVSRECRCGLSFVNPTKWLQHLRICPEILKDKELFDYGRAILEMHSKEEEEAKPTKKSKKKGFECRCGAHFKQNAQLSRHQKLCFSVKEVVERIRERKNASTDSKEQKGKRRPSSRKNKTSSKNKRRKKTS